MDPVNEGSGAEGSADAAGGVDLAQLFWSAAGAFPAGASPREVARRACAALAALQAGRLGGAPGTAGVRGSDALLAELAEGGVGPYAAPEMVRGDACDERALVFAVGVLLFERLTAHHPFGSTQDVRVARLRRGELGSGVNYFPAVPGQLRAILLRAMGPFPEVRYDGLAALHADLARFADSGGEASADSARKSRATANSPALRAAAAPPAPLRADPSAASAARPEPRASQRVEGLGAVPLAPPPPRAPATPASALAAAPAASAPGVRAALPRWLVPSVSFLAGVAVATAVLVLAGPTRQGPPGSPKAALRAPVDPPVPPVRAAPRPAQPARPATAVPAATAAAPRAQVALATERSGVLAGSDRAPLPAGPGRIPAEGEPGPIAAARRVLASVRRCRVAAPGARLRIAVYAQASGRVVRGFVRGDEVGPAQVACIRSRLRGLDLGLRLSADDFVEWAVRLRASAALDEVRVLRPRQWVKALPSAAAP